VNREGVIALARGKATPVGESPLAHMSLLAGSPERVLALRLALSSVVGPSSSVLDAGCGSLGIFAIMAAKLGARRAVGVDLGRLELAQALAEENGVADRVQFLQRDLADLDDSLGTFDVIVGMIYHNDLRLDIPQQQLMSSLAKRLAHSSTAIIPNKVRYSVTGYAGSAADRAGLTSKRQWEESIERVEAHTGVTLSLARRLLDQGWRERRGAGPLPPVAEFVSTRRGCADRRTMTQLTARQLFTEIEYSRAAAAWSYPPSVRLPVTQAGRLDTTVWRQDLLFDELLIRSTETAYLVTPAGGVAVGDTAVLSTGGEWGDAIAFSVDRAVARPGTRLGKRH
jgi:SAM-dependent methyltransferase